MTLSNLVGHEGRLEVVVAVSARGAEALPVTLVVAVTVSATGVVTDLPGKAKSTARARKTVQT